jgi:uncharacterized membrane protein
MNCIIHTQLSICFQNFVPHLMLVYITLGLIYTSSRDRCIMISRFLFSIVNWESLEFGHTNLLISGHEMRYEILKANIIHGHCLFVVRREEIYLGGLYF